MNRTKKLFNLIINETIGDSFESGGQYIDFENGKFIGEEDINKWIDEFEDMNEKVQQVLDQCFDENLFTKEEANKKIAEITGTDEFYTRPSACYSNFNLNAFVLYKAKKIEEEPKEIE